MARIMRRATRRYYFSIPIGLILLIQVIQVYPCESSTCSDSTGKSTNGQFNSAETFPEERRTSSDNNKIYGKEEKRENVVMKLLGITSRASKQARTDERANYEEDEWKTFSTNNKNSLSANKYFNEFQFNDDAPSRPTYDDSRIVFPDDNRPYIPYKSDRPTSSRPIYDESRIVFPDEDTPYLPIKSNLPTCKDSVMCDNVPNYPIDIIERQLSEKEHLKYFQSRDEIVEITNRIGSSDDEPLCLATEEVKYPRLGLTRHDTLMYVVNGENFVQAVRVEVCKNEDSPCRLINEFASGYKTMCEQKYIYRQLLGIHKNGTLVPEYFQIPSSCCCHVKFIGNTWERMGREIISKSSINRKE